jgi:heme-degrading monooxygenase HmoA
MQPPSADRAPARNDIPAPNPANRRTATRYGSQMIREHAILDVIPGEEARFELAFAEAKSIIASMPGFRSLTLDRGIEQPTRYLLLVEWDRLEDHTEGFRGSPEYARWKALLHHFYDPFPTVDHYAPVHHA